MFSVTQVPPEIYQNFFWNFLTLCDLNPEQFKVGGIHTDLGQLYMRGKEYISYVLKI